MRVSSVLPAFCVFGTILASPARLVARETIVIENAIRSVQASLHNLASAIQSLEHNRSPSDLATHVKLIQHHGGELTDIILDGARRIRAGPNVDLFEATKLLSPVNKLADDTQAAVNAWIAARSTIIRSGGKEVVLRILKTQQSSADQFTEAMVSKMPEVYKYIGKAYGQRVRSSVELAVRSFS